MSDEFDLIATIVDALGDATAGEGVVLGPGDDAAVLRLPPNHELVISNDTLVAGRHFPAEAAPWSLGGEGILPSHAPQGAPSSTTKAPPPPSGVGGVSEGLGQLVGYRAIAVSVSDLAAMGAKPLCAVVSLTAERLNPEWARAYAFGMAQAARAFQTPIVGGNLARGNANICVAVHGSVPHGQALTRAGANAGDDLYVTGRIGGAGLALSMGLLKAQSVAEIEPDSAQERYWLPEPRLAIGQRLRGIATAAIDISDGLASDVAHICKASNVGCEIDLADVPTFPGADPIKAACAGDDYELAFTAPPENATKIAAIARDTKTPIQRIGSMIAKLGANWRHDGRPITLRGGFRHF